MTRVERGGSVTYVERHWRFSIVVFALAVAVGVWPAIVPPADPEGRKGAWAVGFALVLGALVALFRMRAFHIDAEAGLLRVVDRGFLRRTRRREFPLRGLRVRTTTGDDNLGSSLWYVWIDVPGGSSLRFAGNLKNQVRLHDLVLQLSSDLGAVPVLPGP